VPEVDVDRPTFGHVLFVRHGHVDVPDAMGRFHSEGSIYLSGRGREQATVIGQHLEALRIDRICASDMPRAAETAEIIGAAVGVPVELNPRFREVNCGSFDGAVLVDLQRDHPEFAPWILAGFLQQFATDTTHFRADVRFPGGESVLDMAERVLPAFRRVCQENLGRVTLVVSHAWPVCVMLCHVLGLPPTEYFRFGTPNTGLSIARVGADGRGMLDAVNIASPWEVVSGGSLPLVIEHVS
jgi:broad specificity phosphatase PhoE